MKFNNKKKFQRLIPIVFPVLVIVLVVISTCRRIELVSSTKDIIAVETGLDVFLKNHLTLVKGKRVGLITNPTGANRELQNIVDLFLSHPDINLVAIYGPEHGVRGNAQAGQYVPFYMDDIYKIPVFSLYGQSLKPDPGMLKNMDEYMRTFDITDTGKFPDSTMKESLDLMIFDIQDIGTRIYTYIATMAYSMQACAEANIPFIVLDRPNPINGLVMEGPILEFPEFSSFVGVYPIPVRHGMTSGELALMFNDQFFETKVDLTVIPLAGWKRNMWFDETGLSWVIPSPNMPALETATVYPGQVFLEGTNISEGRGTTKPFEFFGAPWIDGHKLSQKLNALEIPGVTFREAWFSPTFSKYQGKLCGGCQIHVISRSIFRSFSVTLFIIQTIRELYPEQLIFHEKYFDRIMGTSSVREALEAGKPVPEIISDYSGDLINFRELRKPYLLYD